MAAAAQVQQAAPVEVDVLVVGGGFSGLACADRVAARGGGASVAVLEAQGRVGGRVLSARTPGGRHADLGGMWVSRRTQPRVTALAAELGARVVEQFDDGRRLLVLRSGEVTSYSGLIPPLSPVALVELQLLLWAVDRMAARLDPAEPWRAAEAGRWDAQTVRAWADSRLWTSGARETVDLMVAMLFGCQPHDVSLLYFLFYVRAAGGLEQLVEVRGAAQDARLELGTHDLCRRLARRAEAGGARVLLGRAARSVARWDRGGECRARVETADGSVFLARRVVMAVPPVVLHASVRFDPPLPPAREALAQRTFHGCYTKYVCFYRAAWWRERGLSGEAVVPRPTPRLPVMCTYDYTDAAGAHPALVAFCTGDAAAHLLGEETSEEARREAVVRSLVRLFGDEAARPVEVIGKAWADDPHARGCPVSVFPPGAFGRLAPALRAPLGVLHWAGTETALEWPGYMEGALEAGARAADEAMAALRDGACPAAPCTGAWVGLDRVPFDRDTSAAAAGGGGRRRWLAAAAAAAVAAVVAAAAAAARA